MMTAGALVGRDRELRLFADVAATARAGTPRVVLVRGPGGIGKSALLDTALEGLRPGPGAVLKTTCAPGTAAFGAACGLLGSAPGAEPLRWKLPVLRSFDDTAGGAETRGEEPPGERQAVFRSILRLLHRVVLDAVARAGELVLVIDDVQHCDAASLRWLDFTLRRAAELPLLVVLALRTEALTSVWPPFGLLERHSGTVLDLGPLPPADAAVLAASALGPKAEAGFTEQCARVADGNPGTLSRLVEVLNGRRVQPVDGEASRVAEIGRTVAPRDMLAVLGHTDHALAVARAVGALGTTDAELVAMLAEVPVVRVREVVELLRRNDFLDESGSAVQVVAPVLHGVSALRREELRGQAGWLLSVAGYPAAHVAEQLLPLPERPPPWMLDILREAARHAPVPARRRFLFAVYRSDPRDPRIRIELAEVVGLNDPDRALELLREALVLTADAGERALVVGKLAAAGLAAGRAPEVLGQIDAMLAELGPAAETGDAAARNLVGYLSAIRVLGGVTDLITIGTAVPGAQALLPADLGVGCGIVAERLIAAARSTLAAIQGESARTALAHATTAARLTGRGHPTAGSSVAAFVCYLAGDRATSLETLGRLIEYSAATDNCRAESGALAMRAMIRAESELSSAYVDACRAVDLSGAAGRSHSVAPRVALATVLVLLDEADTAATVLGEPTTSRVREYHEYLVTRARIRWAQGDARAAMNDLIACGDSLRAMGVTNPVFVPWWVDLARLLADLGRADEAVEAVEQGTELARRWGTRHALGLARLAQGTIAHHDRAPAVLSEAVELLASAGDRVRQVQAEHLLGLALARGGDLRAGRARLRHAVDLAVRWGQVAHASWARTDLESLGGRMGRRDEVWTGSLTPSERRVVDLAASGTPNREIAESLVVSLRTVEIHLTSAYRKLGVSGRRQLAGALARTDTESRG